MIFPFFSVKTAKEPEKELVEMGKKGAWVIN
jgi:hypothetical protein